MSDTPIPVIGGGLAGCEAAWQLARAGVPVELLNPFKAIDIDHKRFDATVVQNASAAASVTAVSPSMLKRATDTSPTPLPVAMAFHSSRWRVACPASSSSILAEATNEPSGKV